MPTYEYECQKCGHAFEAFQQMSAQPLKSCPECKGKLRRLISSGAGFIFKGSGFYATDYRKQPHSHNPKSIPPACPKAKEGCDGCANK